MAVKTRTEREKQMNRDFYRLYDIAEWHEKSLILSQAENISVLEDIKNGVQSELIALLKMPFPTFCRLYFGQYPSAENWFKDPAMAYKLYFLDDTLLRFFSESIRNPEMNQKEIVETFDFPKQLYKNRPLTINILAQTNLENIPKIMSASGTNRMYEIKYAYITQYIDTAEAQRLGLPISALFEIDNVNGFDLEGKLAILNPVARLVMVLYLGLYGEQRNSANNIAQKIGVPESCVVNLINILFPRITRTVGEFQNALGFIPEHQEEKNMFEYANRQYRELDIKAQTTFIYRRLSEEERLMYRAYSNRDLTVQLAKKYMFRTPESLARNMVLSLEEADKLFDGRHNGYL